MHISLKFNFNSTGVKVQKAFIETYIKMVYFMRGLILYVTLSSANIYKIIGGYKI